jgi:hypothetical protein
LEEIMLLFGKICGSVLKEEKWCTHVLSALWRLRQEDRRVLNAALFLSPLKKSTNHPNKQTKKKEAGIEEEIRFPQEELI